MAANVTVSTDELASLASKAKEMGDALESAVHRYLGIMTEANGKALIGGSASQNLQQFIGLANSLEGKMDVIGTEVDAIVKKFAEQTDADDHFSF